MQPRSRAPPRSAPLRLHTFVRSFFSRSVGFSLASARERGSQSRSGARGYFANCTLVCEWPKAGETVMMIRPHVFRTSHSGRGAQHALLHRHIIICETHLMQAPPPPPPVDVGAICPVAKKGTRLDRSAQDTCMQVCLADQHRVRTGDACMQGRKEKVKETSKTRKFRLMSVPQGGPALQPCRPGALAEPCLADRAAHRWLAGWQLGWRCCAVLGRACGNTCETVIIMAFV